MTSVVYDPLDLDSRNDYFSRSLHLHALEKFTWFLNSPTSIRTRIPLAGCEPLTGLRSFTCESFTAFALKFNTLWPIDATTELSKFTNGASGISVQQEGVKVHAKSAGFDETSSGRLDVVRPISPYLTVSASVEAESLEQPNPIVKLGASWEFKKNLFILSQVAYGTLDVAKVGIKFQPCGHMHAGLGLSLDRRGNVYTIESSVYAETHSGATVGVLGRYNMHKRSNLQVFLTQPFGSRLESAPNDEGVKVVIPRPKFGFMYDMLHEKYFGFVDLSISAQTTNSMNLGVKIGMQLVKNEPRFGAHLTAFEST
jgi:hypothetical protein